MGKDCGYSETSEGKGPMSAKQSGYGGKRARMVSSYGIHAVIEGMNLNNVVPHTFTDVVRPKS